jgi:hypothetical protein
LLSEYREAELSLISKDAVYEGDYKWKFTAFFHGKEVSIERELKYSNEDESVTYIGGKWFYRAVITQYDLAVEGNYYDRVGATEILSLEQSNVEITKNDWQTSIGEALE